LPKEHGVAGRPQAGASTGVQGREGHSRSVGSARLRVTRGLGDRGAALNGADVERPPRSYAKPEVPDAARAADA